MTQTLRRRPLFISACAGILIFGIVLAVLGTVFGLPEMRTRLGIDAAGQGNLLFLLYLGIFVASVLVGPLIDHLGNKVILSVSSAIVAVAMVLFAAAHSFAAASVAATLLGLGGGGLNTCPNVVVSDLYGDERGPMLNLLGMFFGIGAVCVPLFAATIEGHFTIPQLFLLCAILAAGCALWYAVIYFPPAKASQAFSLHDILEVARYDGVLLLGFILFFESGNEACIGGWTSTYVDSNGHSPRIATLVLAAYWGALMLGRMLAAPVLRGIKKSRLIVGTGMVSLAGCVVLVSARSLGALFVGAAVIGLSYGPIFPTTLAIAGDRYSKRAGTVFGLLFSIALIGGMVLPPAVGNVSQRAGIHAGMIVPLLGALGIIGLSAAVMWQGRNSAAMSKTAEAGS